MILFFAIWMGVAPFADANSAFSPCIGRLARRICIDSLLQNPPATTTLYEFPPEVRRLVKNARAGAALGVIPQSNYQVLVFHAITESDLNALKTKEILKNTDSIVAASLTPGNFVRLQSVILAESVRLRREIRTQHVPKDAKFPRFDDIEFGTVLRMNGRYFVVIEVDMENQAFRLGQLPGRFATALGDYISTLNYTTFHLDTDTVYEIKRLGRVNLENHAGGRRVTGWSADFDREFEESIATVGYRLEEPARAARPQIQP